MSIYTPMIGRQKMDRGMTQRAVRYTVREVTPRPPPNVTMASVGAYMIDPRPPAALVPCEQFAGGFQTVGPRGNPSRNRGESWPIPRCPCVPGGLHSAAIDGVARPRERGCQVHITAPFLRQQSTDRSPPTCPRRRAYRLNLLR